MTAIAERDHVKHGNYAGDRDDCCRTVEIHVNNEGVFLQPGEYDVPTFKKVAGVPQAEDLDELVRCKLVPIADGGKIRIEGCEVFISHVKDGGAS